MAVLDMQEEEKVDAINALMSGLNKYVTNERRLNEAKLRTMEEADLENLDGYVVEQIDETNFILKHEDGGKAEHLISLRQEEGEVIFEGLPESIKTYLNNFSYEEQIRYPVTVLSVILRQTY